MTQTSPTTRDSRGITERTARELKKLSEQARLKLHLASMDARTHWKDELEPRIREFQNRAAHVTGGRSDELVSLGRQLSSELRAFVDRLERSARSRKQPPRER